MPGREELAAYAETNARGTLCQNHPEEFEELYRVELLKAGMELVTLRRVLTKRVSETEARILERHGWERVDDE